MTRILRLLYILLAGLLFAESDSPATARTDFGIIAVVNDEIISNYDLDARMRLVLFSTGLSDSPDIRKRLRSQVLQALIDDKLKLQEAHRKKITVGDQELSRAIRLVEEQNGIPEGQLEQLLDRNGVPMDALVEQTRASLSWSRLIERRLRRSVSVGEQEVDSFIKRIKSRQGQVEYRLGDITLAVDRPDKESEALDTARRIVWHISQGAKFAEVARQFSQSATAAIGGDLGWVHESELDKTLRDALSRLKKGQITPPLRTISGYRILLLLDRRRVAESRPRSVRVGLQRLQLEVDSGTESGQELIARVGQLRQTSSTCEEFSELAVEAGLPKPSEVSVYDLESLATMVRNNIETVPVGEFGEPIKRGDGVLLLAVCSREEIAPALALPDRRVIKDRLMGQRLDLMARRYLRDLRLAAVVDYRG